MADLLGSIMTSMEKAKPKQAPTDEKQRDLIKSKILEQRSSKFVGLKCSESEVQRGTFVNVEQ